MLLYIVECADVCFTSLRIHLKVIYLNTCTENFNVLVLTTFTIEVSLCMVNDCKIKWFSVYGPNILKNSLLMLGLLCRNHTNTRSVKTVKVMFVLRTGDNG